MRLAYFCYGVGLVRAVLYHKPGFRAFVSSIGAEIDDPVACQGYPPFTSAGPVMRTRGFFMEARNGDEVLGECHCEFWGGTLHITKMTGIFTGTPDPIELKDKETISAYATQKSIGLPPTDIVLLSRRWQDMHHLHVEARGLQLWDADGITDRHEAGRRRFTGWSVLSGGFADELSVALVAVASGPESGKTGILLWGKDGGICMSGKNIIPAAFVPSVDDVPLLVSDSVSVPPKIIFEGNPAKPRGRVRSTPR